MNEQNLNPGAIPASGLSEEDNQKVKDIYSQHGRASSDLGLAQDVQAKVVAHEAEINDPEPANGIDPSSGEYRKLERWERDNSSLPNMPDSTGAQGIVDNAQDSYDLSVIRGQKHFEQHMPEYVEQAKIDAAAEGISINSNAHEELLTPSALEAQLGLEHLDDIELRLNRAEALLAALLQECQQVPNTFTVYGKKTMEISIEKVDKVLDQFRSKKTMDDRNIIVSEMRNQAYDEASN